MKTIKPVATLRLSRETLRQLNGDDLQNIVGGIPGSSWPVKECTVETRDVSGCFVEDANGVRVNRC